MPSLFLPAAARHLLREAAAGLTVAVTILAPSAPPPPHVLVAPSIADKQHRWKTWRQNFERYALHPDAKVSVQFRGSDALRRLLPTHPEEAPI
jgi:hypothetical protein